MKKTKFVLKVFNSCGLHCVSIEEGAQLYKNIIKIFSKNDVIYLDFNKVSVITSSFLNASIGRLVGKLGKDFDKKLFWVNLDRKDSELIQLVVENATEHFGKKPKEKRIESIVNQRLME